MGVRRATPEDARGIAEVHVRSWQATYRGLIPQDYLDALDPARQLEARAQRIREVDWTKGGCLVAEDGDVLIGFVHFGATRDNDDGQESTGEVAAIYLASESWGKGIGRELMTAALAHLAEAGYAHVTLWVLDTNSRARSFYEKAGFAADGAVKVDDRGSFQLREVRYRRPLP
jgi:ribosomal protein S18 acetylase RimI-like enzyme